MRERPFVPKHTMYKQMLYKYSRLLLPQQYLALSKLFELRMQLEVRRLQQFLVHIKYLYDNGYDICGEYVSREENKYYNSRIGFHTL